MVHGSDSQAWERKDGGEEKGGGEFVCIPSGATLLKYKLTPQTEKKQVKPANQVEFQKKM